MTKNRLILLTAAILLAGFLFAGAVNAGTYLATKSGDCFQVNYEGVINKRYVIYKCRTCKCGAKKKLADGVRSMSDAINYLEKYYGQIEPYSPEE